MAGQGRKGGGGGGAKGRGAGGGLGAVGAVGVGSFAQWATERVIDGHAGPEAHPTGRDPRRKRMIIRSPATQLAGAKDRARRLVLSTLRRDPGSLSLERADPAGDSENMGRLKPLGGLRRSAPCVELRRSGP